MVSTEHFLGLHRRLTQTIHDPEFLQQPRQAKLVELVRFSAIATNADRISLWRMHSHGKSLSCECLRHASGAGGLCAADLPELEQVNYPNYFATLAHTGFIHAPNAQADEQLNEFSTDTLKQAGIASTLQVPIYGNDGLEGVLALSSESAGRIWSDHDIALAAAVAENISLTNLREDWYASQQLLEHMALHDSITGLPNQNALVNHLTVHLAELTAPAPSTTSAPSAPNELALLWLDIDRFKAVAESVSDSGLNQVVSLIAMRLQQSCKSSVETVARLSKDEFAIVLEGTSSNTTFEDFVMRIDALHKTLGAPYDINGRNLDLTTSIGVARFQGQPVKSWLREAEGAMLEAKSRGGNCTVHYSTSLQNEREGRITLEMELRRALEAQELCLHFQPIMDAQTNQIVCAEALVRWQHPTRGLIGPGEFLPLASRVGLMGQIDNYVLRQVCGHLRALHDLNLFCRVAVNLSGVQLSDNSYPAFVRQLLTEHELTGDCLEIEVTEHATKGDPFAVATNLQRLSEMGIQLAIDDFGTGYSSLARLKYMPFNKLKIDRSFVNDLPDDADVCSMVKAIQGLACGLSLRVVAEGIETQAQRQWLTEQGIDSLQGFLLSHPLPLSAFRKLLQAQDHKAGGSLKTA